MSYILIACSYSFKKPHKMQKNSLIGLEGWLLHSSNFFFRFVGGELNICYNAVDRHVENGRGDQIAIIYDSPVTNTKEKITYKELLEQVCLRITLLLKMGSKYCTAGRYERGRNGLPC